MSHKHAAFHSMIDRLISIPLSEEAYSQELEIIKEIAVKNGYERNLIDQLLFNKIKKSTLEFTKELKRKTKNSSPILWTTFGKTKTKNEKIKITIYRTPITLGKELSSNKKDRLPNMEKEGVYSLKCGDCNVIYIGKTERNFQHLFAL